MTEKVSKMVFKYNTEHFNKRWLLDLPDTVKKKRFDQKHQQVPSKSLKSATGETALDTRNGPPWKVAPDSRNKPKIA